MPVYKEYKWEDSKVLLEPAGIRGIFHRCKMPFNLPYFTGSDFDLMMTLVIMGKTQGFHYQWDFNYMGEKPQNIGHSGKTAIETQRLPISIKIPCLSNFGHHVLFLKITHQIDNSSSQERTVRAADFYVLERDKLTVDVLCCYLGP